MNCLWQEKGNKIEDNIIKDVRYLFRLKGEIDHNEIKDKKKTFLD